LRDVGKRDSDLRSSLDEAWVEKHYQFQPVLVCLCHPTSDRDLDAVIDDGARTVQEIGQRCGAGTGCGACVDELRDRLVSKGANGCGRDCSSDLISVRPTR
jgi:bacterioferritin-associated ferredoxin